MADIVIGRRGDSLTGQVQEKSFTIKGAMGELTFKKKLVAWIHFAGSAQFPQDELWLHSGDSIRGKVRGGSVHFRVRGQTLTVAFENIHTLMIGATLDSSALPLSG